MVLTYNYWSDENEKKYLKKCFYDNEETFQKKLSEKYSTDNLFKSKTIKAQKVENSAAVVKYEDTIFVKLKSWFKCIFHK